MYKTLKLIYVFSKVWVQYFRILLKEGIFMTIKKKGDNNWEYCVYLVQDENGKKKYKRKCGFKTKKACIEEASTFENISNKKGNKTKIII